MMMSIIINHYHCDEHGTYVDSDRGIEGTIRDCTLDRSSQVLL